MRFCLGVLLRLFKNSTSFESVSHIDPSSDYFCELVEVPQASFWDQPGQVSVSLVTAAAWACALYSRSALDGYLTGGYPHTKLLQVQYIYIYIYGAVSPCR